MSVQLTEYKAVDYLQLIIIFHASFISLTPLCPEGVDEIEGTRIIFISVKKSTVLLDELHAQNFL